MGGCPHHVADVDTILHRNDAHAVLGPRQGAPRRRNKITAPKANEGDDRELHVRRTQDDEGPLARSTARQMAGVDARVKGLEARLQLEGAQRHLEATEQSQRSGGRHVSI